jgi:hypothetical protein
LRPTSTAPSGFTGIQVPQHSTDSHSSMIRLPKEHALFSLSGDVTAD